MDAYSKKVEAEAQENQRTNFSQIYLDKKLSLEVKSSVYEISMYIY